MAAILQNLLDTLTQMMGPSGPIIALAAAGMFCIVLTIPFFLKKEANPFDRIANNRVRTSVASASGSGETFKLRTENSGPKLDRFAAYLEPTDEEELKGRKLIMMQAGFRSRNSVRNFHFAQLVLALLGLLIGLVYAFFFAAEPEITKLAAKALAPGVGGYYFPIYWVKKKKEKRKKEIEGGFPDSLDLLLVCVEAGQSLDQSIQRVSIEIVKSHPALAQELSMVAYEMQAGKDKGTVLRDLAERCGDDDIKAFVTVMIQSASFGTPIGDALRVYAGEMRDKRVMRAEEKANTLPVKMTLCTMAFTVPPLLIILVGPSIYEILEVLG